MKRVLRLVCVVLLALLTVLAIPLPVFAADTFTLDEPTGKYVLVVDGEVLFTGTVSPVDDLDLDVLMFIDGRLVTCGDEQGNDIDEFDCLRTWANEGSAWDFPLEASEVERLGFSFLGPHEIRLVLTRYSDGTKTIQAEKNLTVEFVTSLPVATPTPTPTPGVVLLEPSSSPGGHETSSRLATGDPAGPSVLSAIRPVSSVDTSAVHFLVTAVVTIILVLLVGLPSALLGQTLSENYNRLFGRMSIALQRATRTLSTPSLPSWMPLTFGIAVATVMSAFVDPGFGVNLGSLRLLASMGIAFALESVAGWLVIRAVLDRIDPELHPRPEFKFGSLVIILIAVILSRIVGFEPGMVFGLVVGLAFGVSLASAREVRVKLIGLSWAFVIGVVGWLGYSVLAGVPGWLPVFAAETLSALAVSSLAALPVALLPLGGMDGGVLFRWNRGVWAGIYGISLFAFFFVLMPMPFSWGEVGTPLATWVTLYLGYAVLAVGVWAWFRFRKPEKLSVKGDRVSEESDSLLQK